MGFGVPQPQPLYLGIEMKLVFLVGLLSVSAASFSATEWPTGLNVKKLSFLTADYADTRKCVNFTDQNDVVYYYEHDDDDIRLRNANGILSILMFAKSTNGTVKLVTADAPEGACGHRKILGVISE